MAAYNLDLDNFVSDLCLIQNGTKDIMDKANQNNHINQEMEEMYNLVQLKVKAIIENLLSHQPIVLLKPSGYYTKIGFKGKIEDGSYQLFSTEKEYLEYIREEGKEIISNDKNN